MTSIHIVFSAKARFLSTKIVQALAKKKLQFIYNLFRTKFLGPYTFFYTGLFS